MHWGGITAANRIQSIFLVNSVLAIPGTGGLHQEERGTSYSGSGRNDSDGLFSQLLKQTLEEYSKGWKVIFHPLYLHISLV